MSEATARSGSNAASAGALAVLCSPQFIIVSGLQSAATFDSLSETVRR
jgi:hypothetical protein